MVTPVTAFDGLTAPSRSDPTNFAARGDAWLGAFGTFQSQINVLAGEVNTLAQTASAGAATATTKAQEAEASAADAAAASGVTKWITGTNYAQGVCAWSPTDFATYRRKVSGVSNTDPSLDSTGWAILSKPSGVIKSLVATNDIAAGDQCAISTSGVTGYGTFKKFGSAASTLDDRHGNFVYTFASGRKMIRSKRLQAAGKSGLAIRAVDGTYTHLNVNQPGTFFRLTADIIGFSSTGGNFIYDDSTQTTHAVSASFFNSNVPWVVNGRVIYAISNGFEIYNLATKSVQTTVNGGYPTLDTTTPVPGSFAVSGNFVALTMTTNASGTKKFYVFTYNLTTGAYINYYNHSPNLGSSFSHSVDIFQANDNGYFFYRWRDLSNSSCFLRVFNANTGVFSDTGYSPANDAQWSFPIFAFDGTIWGYGYFHADSGYAWYCSVVDNATNTRSTYSAAGDPASYQPRLMFRAPDGTLCWLAASSTAGALYVYKLTGASSVSGSGAGYGQYDFVVPMGSIGDPRKSPEFAYSSYRFSSFTWGQSDAGGSFFTFDSWYGGSSSLTLASAHKYKINHQGVTITLSTPATNDQANAANQAYYVGSSWTYDSAGKISALSRCVNGNYHTVDAITLANSETATLAASANNVQFIEKVAAGEFIASSRVGTSLSTNYNNTTQYDAFTTSASTQLPSASAQAVALETKTAGNTVSVLVAGEAALVMADTSLLVGSKTCFTKSNQVYIA